MHDEEKHWLEEGLHFERAPLRGDKNFVLRFLSSEIEPQNEIKILGVVFDAKLQMTARTTF